ncbi:MAG TPA: hypothetical protein VFI41_04710 [Gemmatimonadales bacterium]|nr:hypothetical protein [Gemmatimonadales bacterium]
MVVVELQFDVAEDAWAFSRMAQEIQSMLHAESRAHSSVSNVKQDYLHMSIDNQPLNAAIATEMLTKLEAAARGELDE